MKTKDLKVGEHYAYSRSRSGAYYQEVELVALHQERPGLRPWSQPETGFVKVRWIATGHEELVRPVNLHHTWAVQEVREKKATEAKRNADKAKNRTLESRAKVAFALHEALVAKGVEVQAGFCYNADAKAALVKAGFKPNGDETKAGNFESTIFYLDSIMDGKVPIEHVAALLEVEA